MNVKPALHPPFPTQWTCNTRNIPATTERACTFSKLTSTGSYLLRLGGYLDFIKETAIIQQAFSLSKTSIGW